MVLHAGVESVVYTVTFCCQMHFAFFMFMVTVGLTILMLITEEYALVGTLGSVFILASTCTIDCYENEEVTEIEVPEVEERIVIVIDPCGYSIGTKCT